MSVYSLYIMLPLNDPMLFSRLSLLNAFFFPIWPTFPVGVILVPYYLSSTSYLNRSCFLWLKYPKIHLLYCQLSDQHAWEHNADEQIMLLLTKRFFTRDDDQSAWTTNDLCVEIYEAQAAKQKIKAIISYCQFVYSFAIFESACIWKIYTWQGHIFLD